MKLNIKDTFGSAANMNQFFTDLTQITDMVRSPHVNFLLSALMSLTISFAQKHKEALDNLYACNLGVSASPQDRKPEPDGSLEETVAVQEKDQRSDSLAVQDRQAESLSSCCGKTVPNCS